MTFRTWAFGLLGIGLLLAIASAPLYAAPAERVAGPTPIRERTAAIRDAESVLARATAESPQLRRAIRVLADERNPASTRDLARVVEQPTRDAMTRSLGALALGEVLDERRGAARLVSLDANETRALGVALASDSVLLRRAAARALGRAKAKEHNTALLQIVEDETEDPVLRYLAGQALTRITGRVYLTEAILSEIVDGYEGGTPVRVFSGDGVVP